MERPARNVIARYYYYATPLFILLDYLLGLNIRAAVLDDMPLYKYIYYGFCIMCGIGVFVFPRMTPIVTLAESTLCFLMITLTVYSPYIRYIIQADDVLDADMPLVAGISAPSIINLVIVGVMAVIGFRACLHVIQTRMKRDRV